MAQKTVTIPITDHNIEGICTSMYVVRYRPSGSETWTTLNPNVLIPPIVIKGLSPSTVYNIEVTRYCCDGSSSTPVLFNITTPT